MIEIVFNKIYQKYEKMCLFDSFQKRPELSDRPVIEIVDLYGLSETLQNKLCTQDLSMPTKQLSLSQCDSQTQTPQLPSLYP